MKVNELRGLSVEDLRGKEKTLKKELFGLNFQRTMRNVEKPHRFGLIKKDIARIMTIIKEKELKK